MQYPYEPSCLSFGLSVGKKEGQTDEKLSFDIPLGDAHYVSRISKFIILTFFSNASTATRMQKMAYFFINMINLRF